MGINNGRKWNSMFEHLSSFFILIFPPFVWSTWPGLWMCWHSLVAENENETNMPVFPPDTLCECLSRAGQRLNELPLESPEGEFSPARPGDLMCWQMIAALFCLTPLFEKSSGFNRKCPHCFDTVAWIPSPPGLAYGHSMLLFMWDNCSAKTIFFFRIALPLLCLSSCFCLCLSLTFSSVPLKRVRLLFNGLNNLVCTAYNIRSAKAKETNVTTWNPNTSNSFRSLNSVTDWLVCLQL